MKKVTAKMVGGLKGHRLDFVHAVFTNIPKDPKDVVRISRVTGIPSVQEKQFSTKIFLGLASPAGLGEAGLNKGMRGIALIEAPAKVIGFAAFNGDVYVRDNNEEVAI